MEKTVLPQGYVGRKSRLPFLVKVLLLSSLASLSFFSYTLFNFPGWHRGSRVPPHAAEIQARCRGLNTRPGPPSHFHDRTVSDRFVEGTSHVWIRNATIWTGRVQGLEVIQGDVFLMNGIIRATGHVDLQSMGLSLDRDEIETLDAHGAFVTPGIVDLHSHMGVDSSPFLDGAQDINSRHGPIVSWLRSIDGLNTHDAAFELATAGGVTTSLILPGSANAIGGEAYVIKPRQTKERSPTSLLVEPPFGLNSSHINHDIPPRWRHLKHACGENPARFYSATRMDTVWADREAYNEARKVKEAQDAYCDNALAGRWEGLGNFPEELKWEQLVEVLRGRVKVQTHCYEATDFDGFIRLSQEFKFPVAAFHHAHEAYLVPDLLKKTYGGTPAIAMFASFSRYKREAFRHSQFAPKILNDAGIPVIMKSDHPGIVSRWLLHEAQQAHYYGLAEAAALSSVISTPAQTLGLDHRIGFIQRGYDADVVVWDRHPLSLGATPNQVFIDGIAQFDRPHTIAKPVSALKAPKTPDFSQEVTAAIEYEGLPPLREKESTPQTILFTNLTNAWIRTGNKVHTIFNDLTSATERARHGVIGVRGGNIVCVSAEQCEAFGSLVSRIVDLEGGAIQPGLVTYGSNLGLQEIAMEKSTVDGPVLDPLTHAIPKVLGEEAIIRAVDGLQYQTRNALLAYRAGITSGIVPPTNSGGFLSGLSVKFSTSALHKLGPGAVIRDVVALHISIGKGAQVSTSTQIALLRRLLDGDVKGEVGHWFKHVRRGKVRLVVDVESADIMATLLSLKAEVEHKIFTETNHHHELKLTFSGATEAHILARELRHAKVGVLVHPRPYPYSWDSRRIIPGPPLTPQDFVSYLISQGIEVGLMPQGIGERDMDGWAAQNLRFDAGWIHKISNGRVSKVQALEIASTNIDSLLGLDSEGVDAGALVVTKGGDLLDFEGKVVAILQKELGFVHLFE
ncbi:carbohydrate esterase family 9 protein [Thelephora terrestris]|uniref:Carbohydrate esterase family 9 protein n=1 Tax=Thelephora terrestris TaxID=56493 RepID=A0A9P6HAZ0_9AGAM|nr:carbohydrate esterase family 9 protein [Thelephora terrestris]